MNWLSKYPEYDILLYGFLCTPCLYGENASHINGHPSCIAHSIAYMSLIIGGNIIGGVVGNCLVQNNPYVMNAFSILFSSMVIGEFAGTTRTNLRKKYSINGNTNNDKIIHCLISPCGVCQEAQEIRERNNNVVYGYTEIPKIQEFTK